MTETDLRRWQSLYAHLLHIERHWTEQVQNQQQRISTILTVNGFLLGFLAIAGFSKSIVQRGAWPALLFLLSLTVLAIAFATGILSLTPGIPISGTSSSASWKAPLMAFRSTRRHAISAGASWLDPAAALRLVESLPEEAAIRAMCTSLVESQAEADHPRVLLHRRVLMYRELVLVLVGLVLLIAALVAFQLGAA